MSTGSAAPFSGLPADLVEVLVSPPVQEKVLAELGVAWRDLAGPEARMAEALRVFVVTWDPLEHHAPRPVAFATVNAGPPGLEVVVYIPAWVLMAAAGRGERVSDLVGELGGSAVVVAAANEEAVVSGRYPALASQGSVSRLLDQRPAGAGLGTPEVTLVSEGWEPIGLGAISDAVQDALGPVDLDRSPIELAAPTEPASTCPACRGGRFAFPGELGESAAAMCPAHRREADRVSSERFQRAQASNPDGWAAVLDACRRLELPHLPNGLASRMVGAEDLMVELREPGELAAVVHDLVEAAGWFGGRAEDLAVALGAEEEMPWLPEWMENLVLDLGRAGLAAEAAEAADALIRIDPDNESTYAADLGCALAEAGDDPAARAKIEASLARWPEQPWVRVHAGDALVELGDADGAEAHFLAALEMAEEADDFELRSNVFYRLAELGRPPAPTTAVRLVGPAGRGRRSRSARLGRNDPCFCGSGRGRGGDGMIARSNGQSTGVRSRGPPVGAGAGLWSLRGRSKEERMAGRVYQLKATIVGTKPPVWRRVLVAESASLLDLHEVLQGAFGWYDCHLHEFEIDGVRYGTDDGEGWGPPPKSERRARLGTVARQGTAIRYVYDFGDDWVHRVVVEKVVQADASVTYPCCIGGKRACPPEDCGGVWGYEEFLAAVSDSDHPEHESMLEWVGGEFDPEAFNPASFADARGLAV